MAFATVHFFVYNAYTKKLYLYRNTRPSDAVYNIDIYFISYYNFANTGVFTAVVQRDLL